MKSDEEEEALFVALALAYGDPTVPMTQDRAFEFVHTLKQLDSSRLPRAIYERYKVWYAKQPKPE